LVDYDVASNHGNWLWIAGGGADSQEYFRIFNPWSQSKEHDPDATYIKRWVPELADLQAPYIHDPDEYGARPKSYPRKIIGHKAARERALKAHEVVKG
jgi:deoxyribodipyrimidine photo-lyase